VTAPAASGTAWCGADGAPLRNDTALTLHDGERRWPVVDRIPWLRAGRDAVRERAVAALDAGDAETAAVVLLADADDWWDAPPPPDMQLRAALVGRPCATPSSSSASAEWAPTSCTGGPIRAGSPLWR
jgi:hypothetical protein